MLLFDYYFLKKNEWYRKTRIGEYDENGNNILFILTEKAPPKAVESYKQFLQDLKTDEMRIC